MIRYPVLSPQGATAITGVTNVMAYGATGNNVTDDTAAIQAALNSGAAAVYVPPGFYNFTSLTLPTTFNFQFFGVKSASFLIQKGTGIKYPVAASPAISQGYISDLGFVGTNGTGNTIDTSCMSGVTLQNLVFIDVPVGFSCAYINGCAGGVYTHDVRLFNIQIYNNNGTAGHSGIRFGPTHSDGQLTQLIMQGCLTTSYCIYADTGALTTQISGSHPYNALIHAVHLTGSNDDFKFTDCTFDGPSSSGNVSIIGSNRAHFVNCLFFATPSGQSAATVTNSQKCKFTTCDFNGAAGAVSCVVETGTSNFTIVTACSVSGTFSAPFNLIGGNSATVNSA